MGDFVPGYEASVWFGVGAPRATPVEIVDKLSKEINAALADPNMKERLVDLGGVALPDLPTVAEFVPGYEASVWFGVGAPKNTPAEIVEKLNKEINAALADPKMKARLADLGATVLPGTPADFARLIADETEKWGNVIRALNIKAE